MKTKTFHKFHLRTRVVYIRKESRKLASLTLLIYDFYQQRKERKKQSRKRTSYEGVIACELFLILIKDSHDSRSFSSCPFPCRDWDLPPVRKKDLVRSSRVESFLLLILLHLIRLSTERSIRFLYYIKLLVQTQIFFSMTSANLKDK